MRRISKDATILVLLWQARPCGEAAGTDSSPASAPGTDLYPG